MPGYTPDETLAVDPAVFESAFSVFSERLIHTYPFFHPMYIGQMMKPPHPVASIGYLAAMMMNPNNHALDGGPVTGGLEEEAIAAFAARFGFAKYLGHLTGGGTVANLEALWIARSLHPDKAIAVSDNAHYTHRRMADVIQAKTVPVAATVEGRMDVTSLEEVLQRGGVGTVVVTLGTTGLGALDPLDDVLGLKEKYGFRVHVDMAYGGYYHLLAETDPHFAVFGRVSEADSVVIDPHKHGLQPYGCGCVMFADPAVGRFYKHDSPYTYFSSHEVHLGEISLECSRPGAAAAALWLTLQCFPLKADTGMGPVLAKTRQAALSFAARIHESAEFDLYLEPELDIVTYFPKGSATSAISAHSRRVLHAGMRSTDYPVYVATLNVSAEDFHKRHPGITVDSDQVTILRSCLMKPEHADWTPQLMQLLEHHARLLQD